MADTPAVVTAEKTFSLYYLLGAFVLGLGIGVLVSVFWYTKSANSTSVAAPSKDANQVAGIATSTTSGVPSTANSNNQNETLTVPDQAAGLYVSIAQAHVTEGDWVVIQEDHMGQPGNTLGAARFVGGATSGTVELLRGTTPGQTYHAVTYKDNGDRIFSLDGDVPLRDASGNPVQVTFKTN